MLNETTKSGHGRELPTEPSLLRSFVQALRPTPSRRRLSLALQGGGSFGAFTWGVLDYLLERNAFTLDCVSGASAGAVNAVVLADGLARGGVDGAREQLERFWKRANGSTAFSLFSNKITDGVAMAALDLLIRVYSPYEFNPLSLNPLRDILTEEVDFARLRHASPIKLLIAATRVDDGSTRLFREHELNLDAVLASACLPLLQPAVEIEGKRYWDGGYSANPPLRPLVFESAATDVLLVRITPKLDSEPPRRAPDIARRINQIAFSNPLDKELEGLADLHRLSTSEGLSRSPLARKLQRLRLHVVCAEQAIEGLSHENALSLDWPFLLRLKESGREAAADWWERARSKRRKPFSAGLLPPRQAPSLTQPA